MTNIVHTYPNVYAVSDFSGHLYLFDKRSPLKAVATARAGNTVHSLNFRGSLLAAACEDGYVRVYDLKNLISK